MIPPRYIYEGDERKAKELRRFAQSSLRTLREAMSFQGLEQDKRTITFSDGTIVKAEISHGLEKATIYCPPVVVEEVEVEEEYSIAKSAGGMLEQGATITIPSAVQGCNEQGANTPMDLCKGAVLPFVAPIIVGADLNLFAATIPPPYRAYQVRGGVPPYTWSISGEKYYFLDDDDNRIYVSEGHTQAPMCTGGAYHGYYGGLEGITGMLFMLMGGGVVSRDLCLRAGGTAYLYRGIIAIHAEFVCGGMLRVRDICGMEAEVELEKPDPFEWDVAGSSETIDRSADEPVCVLGGAPPFHWTVSNEHFWFDAGYTLKEIDSPVRCIPLYADASACGYGTITVSDACGGSTSGVVRCTSGGWNICAESNGTWNCAPSFDYEVFIGNLYVVYWKCCSESTDHCIPCTAECPDGFSLTKHPTMDCPEGFQEDIGYLHIYKWGC